MTDTAVHCVTCTCRERPTGPVVTRVADMPASLPEMTQVSFSYHYVAPDEPGGREWMWCATTAGITGHGATQDEALDRLRVNYYRRWGY